MTGKSVSGHVGESRHHTAAEGTAEDRHVTDPRPGVSCNVILLNVIGGAKAIEAPDNKELIIDHFNPKVAAGGHHGGHFMPGVGRGIVGLHAT